MHTYTHLHMNTYTHRHTHTHVPIGQPPAEPLMRTDTDFIVCVHGHAQEPIAFIDKVTYSST